FAEPPDVAARLAVLNSAQGEDLLAYLGRSGIAERDGRVGELLPGLLHRVEGVDGGAEDLLRPVALRPFPVGASDEQQLAADHAGGIAGSWLRRRGRFPPGDHRRRGPRPVQNGSAEEREGDDAEDRGSWFHRKSMLSPDPSGCQAQTEPPSKAGSQSRQHGVEIL